MGSAQPGRLAAKPGAPLALLPPHSNRPATSTPPRPVPRMWCAKTNFQRARFASRVRFSHWY